MAIFEEETYILGHLTRILYPPLSEKWLKPAVRAIRLTRAGLGNYRVQLPSGVSIRSDAFVKYLMLEHFVKEKPE